MGLSVYAVSLGLLGLAPELAATAFAVALFGFGYGIVFPAMAASVGMAAGERRRGAAFGLFMACFSLGFVVVPPLGGLLADTSPLSPFVAAAALCVLGAVVVALMGVGSQPGEARPARGDNFNDQLG